MTTYSSLGGIRAVTILDVIKCAFLLIFIPIFANIVTFNAGGIVSVLQKSPPEYLLVSQHKDFFKYICLFVFFAIPIHMFQPIVVQRLLLINNDEISSKSMLIYGLIRFVLIFITTTLALSLMLLLPQIDAKEALYTAALSISSPVLRGLIITSFIAIIMCKADAHLNSSSIVTFKNLFGDKLKGKFKELSIIRFLSLALGAISVYIASLDLSIIKVIVFIETLWSIAVGIPLIAGIIGAKLNSRLFAVYSSLTLSFYIIYYLFDSSYYTSLLSVSVSIMIFVLINVVFNKEAAILKNNHKNSHYFLKKIKFSVKNAFPTFEQIIKFLDKRIEIVGSDYFIFSVFFCINYTVPYFMWDYSQPNFSGISIILRGIALVMCFILLIKNLWPKSLLKYFSLYWYSTIMVALPFMTVFMLFLEKWSVIWVINFVLATFLLVLLTDWIMYILITLLGAILATLIYKLIFGSIQLPSDISTGSLVICTFVYSILMGIIFARRKEKILDYKVEVANLFGEVIAHEMRTSLLSIKNYTEGLKDHLPVLVDGYIKAYEKKVITKCLSDLQISAIKKMHLSVEKIIDKSFSFIRLLLSNVRGPKTYQENQRCYIKKTLRVSIKEYPMDNRERKRINLKLHKDFLIGMNEEVLKHIMFNLISNALYFTSNRKNPKILITTVEGIRCNYLIFRDNGVGIDQKDIAMIFNKFYSKSKKGTGLGLSFCKIAMSMLGGGIECRSIKDQYTEFILKFPELGR